MADTIVSLRPINAASFSLKYTVTAADEAAQGILFDFQTGHDLVATAMVTAPTTGAVVVSNIAVSYPAAGQVRVFGTGLAENQTVTIVAGINGLDAALKV
ncbi:MAG TPA: hypothetical protein P5023_04790 [Bacteroidales bacterium]|nr:hypothetical protein [Bacteroidales bacterium]